ncbi:MATE family efflux transporter [Pseudaquabacterium terrae]|uniref:MATE family efflux transporter n=1 Tax=Pseudaquabacterium terrae TaxID=2732868 RepID=UPI001FE5E92A|nr:MATE family efflux transporter [Aquabacterium terrae]
MTSLAWPLLVELLLGIGVGVVGTVLAAKLSDASGAAFALANHVAAMLFLLFRIVGAGISVVVSQNLGGGRRDRADAVALATLGASGWIGGAGALLAAAGAAPLLRLMNAPADVLPLALPFLVALAPALLLDAYNASMSSVLRAHLRTRETLAVIVVMHCVHLALLLPAVKTFGLVGYALALAVSRMLGFALHLVLWRSRLGLKPRGPDWLRLPREELGAVLHIGLPAAAENMGWRAAFMVSLAVVGQFGAQALATHAYVMQVIHVILLFGLATGLAVEIVIGHQIGAGHLHDAHKLVRRALARGIVVSFVLALAAALGGRALLGIFTQDERILALGVTLLWLTVLLEPGRTFNLVVINALRATGDARYPVVAGAASMLLVLAGGSWLLGAYLGWGLPGVWIAYAADEWIRGLLMWRRWARHDWVPYARATHRRMRASALP